MADTYDPVPDLARLLHAALLGGRDGSAYAERVAVRLGLDEDDDAETITAELRKALGLGARTVTYDMADWDTYTVLTLAMEELAASQMEQARDGRHGAMRQRAALADEMRRRAVAAWEVRGE